jgi:hypothetical protein
VIRTGINTAREYKKKYRRPKNSMKEKVAIEPRQSTKYTELRVFEK